MDYTLPGRFSRCLLMSMDFRISTDFLKNTENLKHWCARIESAMTAMPLFSIVHPYLLISIFESINSTHSPHDTIPRKETIETSKRSSIRYRFFPQSVIPRRILRWFSYRGFSRIRGSLRSLRAAERGKKCKPRNSVDLRKTVTPVYHIPLPLLMHTGNHSSSQRVGGVKV